MTNRQAHSSLPETLQDMLVKCHRARPADLMSPSEVEALARDRFPDLHDRGWAICSMVSTTDLILLAENQGRQSVRFALLEFVEGLPVAVFMSQAGGVQFRWAVPMWEEGAQEWLEGVVTQQRIILLLNAADSDAHSFFVGECPVLKDRDKVLAAGTARELHPDEASFSMFIAGLRLMQEDTLKPLVGLSKPDEIRVMVAARGDNASFLMGAFAEALRYRTQDSSPDGQPGASCTVH